MSIMKDEIETDGLKIECLIIYWFAFQWCPQQVSTLGISRVKCGVVHMGLCQSKHLTQLLFNLLTNRVELLLNPLSNYN